jgi:transcriptional regulator with PAS, ATPase and Fis domain
LRVLQDKNIHRVGGTSQIKVDIRIIAATHQNLLEMVKRR